MQSLNDEKKSIKSTIEEISKRIDNFDRILLQIHFQVTGGDHSTPKIKKNNTLITQGEGFEMDFIGDDSDLFRKCLANSKFFYLVQLINPADQTKPRHLTRERWSDKSSQFIL